MQGKKARDCLTYGKKGNPVTALNKLWQKNMIKTQPLYIDGLVAPPPLSSLHSYAPAARASYTRALRALCKRCPSQRGRKLCEKECDKGLVFACAAMW